MNYSEHFKNQKGSILKTLVLSFLLFGCALCFCKTKKEIIDSSLVKIEKAIIKGDNETLLKELNVLYSTDTVLPDVSSFYLGYTLYKYDELESGKNALLRYIDLTKETGLYYDSVVTIINRIDEELDLYEHHSCSICKTLGPLSVKDTCTVCEGMGVHVKECHRCEGLGDEVCPTCRGTGYETSQTQFYVNYVTCHTCLGKGSVECSNCQGSKKEKSACEKCLGDGFSPRERICTHRPIVLDEKEKVKEEQDNSFSR